MRRVRAAISASVMAAVFLVFASAAYADKDQVKVKVATQRDGPYKEFRAIAIPGGTSGSVFWRVRNVAGRRLNGVQITEGHYMPGWVGTWFRRERDITAGVQAGEYSFALRPGRSKIFRLRLKAPQENSAMCFVAAAAGPNRRLDAATAGVNAPICPFI